MGEGWGLQFLSYQGKSNLKENNNFAFHMHRWPPETGAEVCGMWISSHKLRLRRWYLNWNGSLQRSRNMTDLFWMFFWNMRTRIKMLVVRQTQEILLFLCSCKGPWSLFSFTSHLATNYMRFCAWGQDMDCLQVATKSVEFDKFTRWLIVPWASSADPFIHGNSQYQEDQEDCNSQASIQRFQSIYEDLM